MGNVRGYQLAVGPLRTCLVKPVRVLRGPLFERYSIPVATFPSVVSMMLRAER